MQTVEHLDIRTGPGHDVVRVDPVAVSSLRSLTVARGSGRDLPDDRNAGDGNEAKPGKSSNVLEFAYAESDEAPSRGLSPRILWAEDGDRRRCAGIASARQRRTACG